jgi:hypothetical protein
LQGAQKAQTVPSRTRVQDRSVEIQNLISRARSLPAEFTIDIFLRIVASTRIDKEWKQEILEEAFTLTPGVQNALREKVIPVSGIAADTRAGYRSAAFDLRLDILSLQSQIIEQMISLDRGRALRMLAEVSPKLTLRTLSCSDMTKFEVTDFYRLIEKVTRAVYDEKRIRQGERVQFLLPYVENMSSPAQITPIVNLLLSLSLRTKESFIVSQSFATALKKISADDRTFSAALMRESTVSNVFRLIESYRKAGVPITEIQSAFRSYLSKHLSGTRCEDNLMLLGKELPYYIKEINYYYPDNPFTFDETKPAKLEDKPVNKEYFESEEAKTLLSDFKNLRGYDDDEPSMREPKTSAAWQEKMLDYLRRLDAWEGRGETTEEDQFHQKCILYLALARIAPSGEQTDQVIFGYIALLSQSGPLAESRIEWLWHVHELIRFIRDRQNDEQVRLIDLLANAKNPVLQVYGELTKVNLF